MEKIEWMNLTRQFNAHWVEWLNAVGGVPEETAFSGEKYEAQCEKDFAAYISAQGAAAVSNGTHALFLAMKALGIGPGDEVIVPADTFIATAWGVSYNGAVPVFADIDPETWEIDPVDAEKRITEKTKAIVGVHLYGQPFDIDAVQAVADRHGLMVLEDCAQAHGARYRGQKVGVRTKAGCFSFYPGKNLGAFGEGGAVTSQDPEVIRKIQILKNHGAEKRYYHDELGYNMRLEGIQGAVLSCKLKCLDGWNARRKEIAGMYQAGLHNPRIRLQKQPDFSDSVYHIMAAEVDDRDRFMAWIEENGVTAGIHYPIPCHLQKAYSFLGYREGDLPVAEKHARCCVSLPMYPELRDDEVAYVIDVINRYGTAGV